MRIGSQLARAEFTLLSRSGTACRTADGEYLFRAEFLFHHKLPLPEERFADQRLKPHGKPHIGPRSLPFPDDGHGLTLQKSTDKCAIYLQAAVIADEAFLLKSIHEFTYPLRVVPTISARVAWLTFRGVLRL